MGDYAGIGKAVDTMLKVCIPLSFIGLLAILAGIVYGVAWLLSHVTIN